MVNVLLFVAHVVVVVAFVAAALLLGRGALVGSVVMQGVLANLFVGKQMALFGLTVTCADAYVVGAVLSLSLLQEYFGEGAARQATWSYLLFAIWYAVMTRFHLAYEPAWADWSQIHFEVVFGHATRVSVASIIAMFAGLWTNRIVLSKSTLFMERHDNWSKALPWFVALVVSQLVDTVIFGVVGLRGVVESLWQVVVMSLVVKVAIGAMATSFVGLVRRVVHHVEE